MSEQRRLKRRHLIYYLRVFDAKTEQLIGHLVDITTEGVMLISESPKVTGVDYDLRMVLPTEIVGKKEINFSAQSIWCRKDINPDFYATGFRLIDMEQEDRHTVEWLIDQFGFRD
jgi:hypothetical protein